MPKRILRFYLLSRSLLKLLNQVRSTRIGVVPKKARYASIKHLIHQETGCEVEELCQAHGVSRQAFYQYQKRQASQVLLEDIVLQLVHQVRARQPRIGTRKLHAMLSPKLEKLECQLGRDALFRLLDKHPLLIRPKRKYTHTTDANHPFRRYDNLIKEVTTQRIHQVFVADITYLDTREGFVYLALLTDLYSRKIVGFDVSDSLAVEGALRALKKALRHVPEHPSGKTRYPLIHHSDRGVQYACYAYTDMLKAAGVSISMSATGNVYENALAERVNGILKLDFLENSVWLMAYGLWPRPITRSGMGRRRALRDADWRCSFSLKSL